MNITTPAAPATKDLKKSTLRKDAICLALVVIAVFILHAFSKSAIENLYKTKEKSPTAISLP